MNHEYKDPHKLKLKNLEVEKETDFYTINCPSCEAGIPADNLNINDKIAKCGTCDVVFPFKKRFNLFLNLDLGLNKQLFDLKVLKFFNLKMS